MRISLTFLFCSIGFVLSAQTPKTLDGVEYRGTSVSEPQEGCEGCGNPGHVDFMPGNQVDLSLPGSDTPSIMHYTRRKDRIRLERSNWLMDLKGDTLSLTAYEYRHVYLRVLK